MKVEEHLARYNVERYIKQIYGDICRLYTTTENVDETKAPKDMQLENIKSIIFLLNKFKNFSVNCHRLIKLQEDWMKRSQELPQRNEPFFKVAVALNSLINLYQKNKFERGELDRALELVLGFLEQHKRYLESQISLQCSPIMEQEAQTKRKFGFFNSSKLRTADLTNVTKRSKKTTSPVLTTADGNNSPDQTAASVNTDTLEKK